MECIFIFYARGWQLSKYSTNL